MRMKADVILLCKNDLKFQFGAYLTTGKYYEIVRFGGAHIMVYVGKSYESMTNTRGSYISPWFLYDYFYTKNEERKIKLDKIKKSTEI